MDSNQIVKAFERRIAVLKQIRIMTEALKNAVSMDNDHDLLQAVTDAARRAVFGGLAVCCFSGRMDSIRIEAESAASEKTRSIAVYRPEIEFWLKFVMHSLNDNAMRYTGEELLELKSDFELPAGLVVPDGLLVVRFKADVNGQSGIRALVVLNKDHGRFTAEDQAILVKIGTFISLFGARAHPVTHAHGNYQLMEMINSIPGFITEEKDEERKQTVEFEASHSKLRDRVDENAASLYMMVKALEDEIEERRRIEKKLRLSQMQQRQLVRKTVETLEFDRQTIAKELHDSIGASLAAIKFSLEDTLAKMDQKPQNVSGSLKKIVGYLVDTIKETKRISANLRPATLDELGLLPTIAWFCRKITEVYQDTRISQKIEIGEKTVPDELKIVIYRVLQEAVNNSLKHGAAKNIKIALLGKEADIELTIADDGCGFNRNKQLDEDPLSGHGIQGMIERVEICGGLLDLYSVPGEGTRLRAVMPRNLPGKG